MLRVDLRSLRPGGAALLTEGSMLPGDPAFEGLDLHLEDPVAVRGALHAANRGTYVWDGEITTRVASECRRCLVRVAYDVDAAFRAILSSDPAIADDPGAYLLPEASTVLDLSFVIREEVALTVSSFPLCREDCAGLCPHCGTDLNQGTCGCAGTPEPH